MTYRNLQALTLSAVLATAALAGCEAMEPDPNSPVAQAEKRGADYAWQNDLKLVSDCGSLQDLDERQGCAKWINNRED
jgi:hypothetical protein